jgi:hypothetical protein
LTALAFIEMAGLENPQSSLPEDYRRQASRREQLDRKAPPKRRATKCGATKRSVTKPLSGK